MPHRIGVSTATIEWLLAEENPAVRYLTLTNLLARDPGETEVRRAKADLGNYPPTQQILAARAEFWRDGADFYHKYRGGYWQLIFLSEFLAPGDSPGVRDAVKAMLTISRRDEPRRIGSTSWPRRRAGWFGIHCLGANLLRAMVGLGFGGDRRVQAGIDFLARKVIEANGVPCVIVDWSVYPTCSMTLPKVLLALTALPVAQRTAGINRAIAVCVERLCANEVSRYVSPIADDWYRDGPGPPTRIEWKPEVRQAARDARAAYVSERGGLGTLRHKEGWDRFGFPLHYGSDTLEAMRALAAAGAPASDPRLHGAVELILDKRRSDGTWNLDFSWNEQMIAAVETIGQPSRWITYQALATLQHFRGLAIG